MKLTHRYAHLWQKSGLLDELLDKDRNPKPLVTYIKQLPKAAEKLARADGADYADYYGWMGEVLCEFWLRLFGHRYDVFDVQDTSADQFQRGYDFTARSAFAEELQVQIQVKMRRDTEKSFLFKELYTFLDEGKKAGILPQYLVLMVPTSQLPWNEVLSYRDGFQARYGTRVRIITGEMMQTDVRELPSAAKRHYNEEFFARFKAAL